MVPFSDLNERQRRLYGLYCDQTCVGPACHSVPLANCDLRHQKMETKGAFQRVSFWQDMGVHV